MLGNARTERRGPVPALCCAIPSDRRRTRIIATRETRPSRIPRTAVTH